MSELYIKQDLIKALPQIDAVVFDVDGVLLDVSESYRVVISRSIQYYITQVVGLEDTGTLLEESEIELFKFAGGFNSDWDLTTAATSFALAKHFHYGVNDTAAIREALPSWEQFTSEIKRRGGGPVVADNIILEMLTPHQRRDFANAWKPKLAVQIFQEMYAGDDACKTLYGFDPEHIHGEGLYQNERAIVDAELISQLASKVKVGVLTGRTRSETQLGMKTARLKINPDYWVTETDGVKKPDGRALLLAQEKIGFKYAIYVGDTMDDLSVVKNYRDTKGSGRARVLSCIVMSGPSGDSHRRVFLEAGTEITAPDVNSIVQYLNAILK